MKLATIINKNEAGGSWEVIVQHVFVIARGSVLLLQLWRRLFNP